MVIQNSRKPIYDESAPVSKMNIAVCPTYYEMARKIDLQKYAIIETQSTAQSLKLLETQMVGMVIAGRVLKASEPKVQSHIICNTGYSFMSARTQTIQTKDLEHLPIYTDLDTVVLSETFGMTDIHGVGDVYLYLDKGIIVTSWKNTDYARAAIVHVMDNEHVRSSLSRRPTIYFTQPIEESVREVSAQLMAP